MIIKNGTVIDPVEKRMYNADILIRQGKVERIVEKKDSGVVDEVDSWLKPDASSKNDGVKIDLEKEFPREMLIDATGLFVSPGLIDTHVHFRDPGFPDKEDIYTGAEAAKKGGYTGVVMMANTKPRIDNPDVLKYVLDRGKNTGIRVYACANITMKMEGKELTDMPSLKTLGAVGFTDDGIPLVDKGIVKSAMKEACALNVPISFHEENPELICENGINAGVASTYYKIAGSPREAEISMIERDIELARIVTSEMGMDVRDALYGHLLGPCFVIQHISTEEGVMLVRNAKKLGLNIHAEATPHHFSLTEMDAIKYGANAKMNPPLRTESDREAIIEGIKDGTIDIIATDHAPHTQNEKELPITEAPSGIIGLETALSLGIQNLVNRGFLTYPELIDRMSTAPAALYGLQGGVIKEGGVADITIFAPNEIWEVKEFASKASNSPFIGRRLPGVVKYTICDGKIVYMER
ncbi:MAG: dihydroorotase [Lachnospiraceae bacterium]|nr:dihydroorotase [Lachnospiraceae bacterium]